MGLEEKVALECRHTLVHWGELVLLARPEGRALRGVVRIELEEWCDFRAGRSGEIEVAHVVKEFVVCAGVANASEHQWYDSYEGLMKRTTYVMFQAPEAKIVPSSSESPMQSVR